VAQGIATSDLLVTIGGVSVGDHDVVRTAMQQAGVSLDFWKVAIKPGKPLCVGSAGRTRVLGLPGNPSSATLTFVLFGVPLLRAMQGDPRPVTPRMECVWNSDLQRQPGRTEFVRVALDENTVPPTVRPLSNQVSGAVTSFAWADALAVIPADVKTLSAGERVSCMRLRDV
jgi:molybdopterin molybdotransferase